jgi:hypothetical protein
MKQILRFPLLLLLLLGVGLAGCDDDDDPLKGKLRYAVTLHVTGENLTGLGAGMEYTTVRNTLTNPHPGPNGQGTYATRVDTTYQLGEYGAYDLLEVKLFMRNLNCQNAAAQLGPNRWLKAEIRANGLLVDKLELNQTTVGQANCNTLIPYPVLLVGVGGAGGGWDD